MFPVGATLLVYTQQSIYRVHITARRGERVDVQVQGPHSIVGQTRDTFLREGARLLVMGGGRYLRTSAIASVELLGPVAHPGELAGVAG